MTAWFDTYTRNGTIFSRHNLRRIEYLRSLLSDKKRDVFDLIPFLLHEGAAGLPGGIECDCPISGITCFSYTPRLRELVKKYFPGFVDSKKAKARLPVVFLALMGSAGTIAFTKESDLDYWVGIEVENNSPDFSALIHEKFKNIEQWAADTADLEVHFFLADLTRIRAEDYGELNKESCGSALGKLLKDEFYRTAMFLQGRIPFYLLMPFGTPDAKYRETILRLCTTAAFPRDSYVDIGNVSRINQAEYFGAALWQLLKGLRSPFKSALKMALLDKYSTEGRNVMPLCEAYKKTLVEKDGRDFVDPYLFMIEELRAFYSAQKLVPVRQLLEECFLIRSLLVEGEAAENRERIEFFNTIGRHWGWSAENVQLFAGFREWDHVKVEELNKKIINFLLEVYKRIRTKTKEAGVRISDRDMTVVGKKLQGFLGKRAGKVQYEFSLFQARDIALIEFVESRVAGAPHTWDVKVRIRGTTSVGGYQIQRTVENPLVGCAWCALNHFYHGRQQLSFRGHTTLTTREAINLISAIDNFFPDDTPETLAIDDLLGEQYVTHLYIIPNAEIEDCKNALKSVFVFCRNTLGELSWDFHPGNDCQQWLTQKLLLDSVGRWRLRTLKWTVHVTKEVISPTRRIGENLSRYIKDFIAQAV
jgi:adenylate cyclase class 1